MLVLNKNTSLTIEKIVLEYDKKGKKVLYEKENGQINDEKWELLKISGGLKGYFKKHSLISLEAH